MHIERRCTSQVVLLAVQVKVESEEVKAVLVQVNLLLNTFVDFGCDRDRYEW